MKFHDFFRYILVLKDKTNSDTASESAGTQSVQVDSKATKAKKKKIKASYDKIKSIKEISLFQSQAIDLIMNHLVESDYKNHQALLREVKFLLHYTFEVLKDDYFIGEKFFKTRMTRIDDYIFSQYSKQENLKHHIKKLRIVSSSNRFDEKPRQNILSYFVFLEESGFEIISLMNDFYTMLDKSQQKSFFNFGKKSIFNLTKKYKKEANEINPDNEVLTLMTQQTQMFSPKGAQMEIIDDLMAREIKK